MADSQGVFCLCQPALECMRLTAQSAKNRGREYYNCPARSCNFFRWADELEQERSSLPCKKRPRPPEFVSDPPTLKRCKAENPLKREDTASTPGDMSAIMAQMIRDSKEVSCVRSELHAAVEQIRTVAKLLQHMAEQRGIPVGELDPYNSDTQPLDETK